MNQQVSLWRETISEADQHWKNTQTSHADQIGNAIQSALSPMITQFSDGATKAFRAFSEGLEVHSKNIGDASERFEKNTQQLFLASHQDMAEQLAQSFSLSHERQEHIFNEALNRLHELNQSWSSSVDSLQSATNAAEAIHQREQEKTTREHTESLLLLQETLSANLTQISESNKAIEHQLSNDLSANLTEAMRYLARSVDQLSKQLSDQQDRNRSVRPAA
jgi:Mg2+ and Co2+ transporter CorA